MFESIFAAMDFTNLFVYGLLFYVLSIYIDSKKPIKSISKYINFPSAKYLNLLWKKFLKKLALKALYFSKIKRLNICRYSIRSSMPIEFICNLRFDFHCSLHDSIVGLPKFHFVLFVQFIQPIKKRPLVFRALSLLLIALIQYKVKIQTKKKVNEQHSRFEHWNK